jgi:hypothetical protein
MEGEDQLRVRDLRPTGGSWGGLLFDNPRIGLPPRMTWHFGVDCEDVDGAELAVDVDWVPLGVASWRAVDGRTFRSTRFAEPAEGSVRFGDTYRFDEVHLRVLAQRDVDIDVWLGLRGDIDGLGIDLLEVSATLTFRGLSIQLDRSPRSVRDAARRLRVHTKLDGLVGTQEGRGVSFRPA